EQLLARLGFWLGKQTVLFSTDARAFASRRPNSFSSLKPPDPPRLDFKSPPSAADPKRAGRAGVQESPLRRGLRVTARSVGGELDLRLRFARPVYFERPDGRASLGALAGLGARALGPGALGPRGGAALGGLGGLGARVGFSERYPSAKEEVSPGSVFL